MALGLACALGVCVGVCGVSGGCVLVPEFRYYSCTAKKRLQKKKKDRSGVLCPLQPVKGNPNLNAKVRQVSK